MTATDERELVITLPPGTRMPLFVTQDDPVRLLEGILAWFDDPDVEVEYRDDRIGVLGNQIRDRIAGPAATSGLGFATVTSISAVLARHRTATSTSERWECTCGATTPASRDAFRRHVASSIARLEGGA